MFKKISSEQIHKEFREAIAPRKLSVPNVEEYTDEHAQLENDLYSLQLYNSKPYQLLQQKKQERNANQSDVEAVKYIKYIEATYPEYRLIGLKRIIELCRKYHLVIGALRLYKEDIPVKNLQEIKAYQAKLKDNKILSNYSFTELLYRWKQQNYSDSLKSILEATPSNSNASNLFIVAPRSYFDKNMSVANHFLISPKPKLKWDLGYHGNVRGFLMSLLVSDPIVLHPCKLSKLGIVAQIATAWGEEARDSYVSAHIEKSFEKN